MVRPALCIYDWLLDLNHWLKCEVTLNFELNKRIMAVNLPKINNRIVILIVYLLVV